MRIAELVEALTAIESERMISKDIVIGALSDALVKAYRKQIEIPDALVRVQVDEDQGELKLFHQFLVVQEVEDDELEIALDIAKSRNPELKLEDFYEEEVDVTTLGRAAAILAKSVMKQKIREAEKQAVYDEYIGKLHEMVTGVVESVEEKFVVINLGKTLAILPRAAQIPGERYSESQRLKVVITEVNKDSKGAQVLVSRADPNLVRRLFENEVPEIYDGIVEIKAIARDPGERCKMSVYSKRADVDPIGACIGQRGQRVKVISEEILGEKIDIFEWSDNIIELIKNSFSPANVLGIFESAEKKGLVVVVEDTQLSLAIGKKGKNARLAVKLTGNKIDIKTKEEIEGAGIDWEIASLTFIAKVENELRKKEIELQEKEAKIVAEQEAQRLEAQQAEEEAARIKAEEAAEAKRKEDEEIEKKIKKAKKSLAERDTSYVSRLEAIAAGTAPAPKKDDKKVTKKKVKEESEERKFRASELRKDKEIDVVKPVYSDEELAALTSDIDVEEEWIEDVDYDEYDEYYDFEE